MEKELMQDFKDDFPMLIEAGFIAVKQLDEMSATRIFHAAEAISPGNSAPKIGLGYIALNKLEIKQATKIFEDVLKDDPDNHLAETFLGICFLLTKPKRKKGEKIIEEVIRKTEDPTVKNLGKISLEWADKDLKKEKSPFFASTQGIED